MLNALKTFFSSIDIDADLEQTDPLKLSAAVLMIEVLAADDVVDQREVDHVTQLLQSQFAIGANDVDRLFERARKESDEAVSLQGFTRQICEHYDNEQRVELLTMLWEVAMVDEHVDGNERHLIRKIAGLLYLTDRQIIQAREAAKSSLS
ncbi:MAG: TerB family tellurite resistance protein [Arenicella sp.]